MRNYTDSCGQQWVDNGMGWVPAQTALWGGGGLGAYGDDFADGKAWGKGCTGTDHPGGCSGCCWTAGTMAEDSGRNRNAVYQGCMYTCQAQAQNQGRRRRAWSAGRGRAESGGWGPAAIESTAQSAALMGNDGRWYAPDGLGGWLTWNGAGWCR